MSYTLMRAARGSGSPLPLLRLAAGQRGGGYYEIGVGIAEVLTRRLPRLEFRALMTDASVENLLLLEHDDAELALTQNDVAFHAVKTERLLGYKSTKIVALAVLFGEVAQMLVNKEAGIRNIREFTGKPIGLGLARSGTRFSNAILLEYFGIGPGEIDASYDDVSESVHMVRDGALAATIMWAAVPNPEYKDALLTGRVELLGIDPDQLRGLIVNHPFYHPVTIPARTYANQERDIPSVGVKCMLVTSRSMNDELVHDILETLFDSIPDLTSYHARASEISLGTAHRFEDGLTIDLHPAAERFFRSRETIR